MNPTALLIPLLGVLWGLNWSAVRLCLDEIPPWSLRALGFALATLILFAAVRLRGGSLRVPRPHWGRLVAVGVFSVAGYNLLSAFALLGASTSRTAVLSYTMPLWAVILARFVLGEPLDRRRIAGLLLGAAGLLALGMPILRAGEASLGLLFALLSGVSWAIGTTVLKRWPVDSSPVVVTAWQMALGALVTTVGMLAVEGMPHPHLLRPVTSAALLYQIVIGQALSTALWFTLLSRLPAGTAAIGSLLVPGVGVIGAALLLGERPTIFDWAGLVLVVAGSASVLVNATVRTSPAASPSDSEGEGPRERMA